MEEGEKKREGSRNADVKKQRKGKPGIERRKQM